MCVNACMWEFAATGQVHHSIPLLTSSPHVVPFTHFTRSDTIPLAVAPGRYTPTYPGQKHRVSCPDAIAHGCDVPTSPTWVHPPTQARSIALAARMPLPMAAMCSDVMPALHGSRLVS